MKNTEYHIWKNNKYIDTLTFDELKDTIPLPPQVTRGTLPFEGCFVSGATLYRWAARRYRTMQTLLCL